MKKKAVEYTLKATKQDFSIAKITNSMDAQTYARQFYHDDLLIYESAFIMLLNKANNVMGFAKISQGGVCGTIVDARIVCKYAIESLAAAVILVHNHPSGSTRPSLPDDNLTKSVKEALKLFNIQLLDHVIISENSYYSYGDEGRI